MNAEIEGLLQQTIEAKRLVYYMLRKMLGTEFYSQATQDIFVTKILAHKRKGFYLEIGGGHPSDSNNTYLLERQYQWSGLSLEHDNDLVNIYNSTRVNKATKADATNFDYQKHLASMNAPVQIDYLSLDIDPAENTYLALENLPHHAYRFSVITFEHDKYQSGEKYMAQSRSLLRNLGYELIVSNLTVFGRDFEDWWIDPTVVSEKNWKPFQHENIEFAKLWI